MDLRLLDSKLSQLINNATSTKLSRVTRQVSQGESFRLEGQTVKALTNIENGQEVLLFKNSSDGVYCAIAGRKEEARVINERVVLSRHTHPTKRRPSPILCELLKLSYIYVIKNEDKTQDLFLVDFKGNHIPIITIPKATTTFDNATWVFNTTFPGFTYKTYELYQSINDTGSIRDPGEGGDLTGYQPPLVVQSTVVYGPDYDVPRPLIVKSTNFGLQDVWKKALFRYGLFGNPSFTGDPNALPPYTIFSDVVDDEDEWFDWSEVYSAGTTAISYVAYEDDDTPAMDIDDGVGGPWGNLNPAYSGSNQNNPDFTTTLISSARWFVTSYDGPMTVSIPEGQSKPPPVDEYMEFETYLSHSNGVLQILVRYTGRPVGTPPAEEEDPWFPEANIHKFAYIGSALEENPEIDLPLWMSIFDSTDTRGAISDYYLGLFEDDIVGNETNAILYYSSVNIGFDFYIDGSRQVVDSGIDTVWGWFFETNLDPITLKEALFFGESDLVQSSYSIFPAQIDYFEGVPGYGGGNGPDNNSAPLPFDTTKQDPLKAYATTNKLDPEDFQSSPSDTTISRFEIKNITASWNLENTIDVCHSTKNVVPWENSSGS